MISTMYRSMGSPGFLTVRTESTTACNTEEGKCPKMTIKSSKVQVHIFHTSLEKLDLFTQRGRGDRDTHLCQDVSELSVDFSPEGCPGNIYEGLPVHLLGHFDLLQNLKCFFLGNLKSFCNYSRVQTLRQGKRNYWTAGDKMVLFPHPWLQHSTKWQSIGNVLQGQGVLSF